MKRPLQSLTLSSVLAFAATTFASEAETSAAAGSGSGRLGGNGNAQATARYEGDIGFARTDSRSGRVNMSRGIAVGVDEDGLSLSISHAIAPRGGPAIAGTLNIGIERDGDVNVSTGRSVANGPIERSASAGGSTTSERGRGSTSAFAHGRTDALGRVQATTRSETLERRDHRRGSPEIRRVSRFERARW